LVKDRKEADSPLIRDNTWDWYKTALRTRLRKDGWIVFVNTRWHEDDPAGRILPENWSGESGWITARDGEEWFVIRLPALAEANDQMGRAPGEPLWPAEKTLKALEQERKALGSRDWNALFQQYPTTEEGAIIKAAYWRKWPEKPAPVVEYVIQSIDGAYEEEEENDYSARTTWGIFDIFHQDNAKVSKLCSRARSATRSRDITPSSSRHGEAKSRSVCSSAPFRTASSTTNPTGFSSRRRPAASA